MLQLLIQHIELLLRLLKLLETKSPSHPSGRDSQLLTGYIQESMGNGSILFYGGLRSSFLFDKAGFKK